MKGASVTEGEVGGVYSIRSEGWFVESLCYTSKIRDYF
jgi:hypothetical protein